MPFGKQILLPLITHTWEDCTSWSSSGYVEPGNWFSTISGRGILNIGVPLPQEYMARGIYGNGSIQPRLWSKTNTKQKYWRMLLNTEHV